MTDTKPKHWETKEYKDKMRALAKASWQNPEIRERRTAAIKEAYTDHSLRSLMSVTRKGVSLKKVEVPKWVPDDLAEEYVYIARRNGEEDAASHVRKLKREMERAE